MADDSLNFTVTSNTSDLENSLKSIIEGLGKAGAAGTEAGATISAGADKATQSITKAKVETNAFDEALEGLGAHSRTVAMGLEAMGLSAEGSAAKVEGMVEAIRGLGSAVPELLVLAAAFAAVAGAIDIMKDGISDAAKINESLGQIAANIGQTGAVAQTTKNSVKEFADQLGSSTGQSADETVAAIQKMTAAQIPLNTAKQIAKDADLESIASGRSSQEVQDALMNAVLGRTRALVQMGIITKEEAKNGIDLDTVNRRILDGTKQAVEIYQNSLPGALAITHENFNQLVEELGEELLPTLIAIVKGVNDGIEAFRGFADTVGPVISNVMNGAKSAFASFGALFKPLTDDTAQFGLHVQAMANSVQQAWHDLGDAIHSFYLAHKAVFDEIIKVLENVGNFIKGQFVDTIQYGLKAVVDAFDFSLDLIKTIADVAIGVLTGHWQKFFKDLPVLANDGLQLLNDAFDGHLAQIVSAAETTIDQLKKIFGQIGKVMDDLNNGNLGAANADMSKPLLFNKDIADDYNAHLKSTTDAMAKLQKQAEATTKAAAGVWKSGSKHGDSEPPGNEKIQDTELGGSTGGDKSVYDPEPLNRMTDATKAYTDAQDALDAALGKKDASLDNDRKAVETATTMAAEYAAKTKLAADQQEVLREKAVLLAAALNTFKADEAQLTKEHNDQAVALQNADNAYTAYANKIRGHTETKEQTAELKELKTTDDALAKTYETTGQQLEKVTGLVKQDTEAQNSNNKAIAEAPNALAAFKRSLDELKTTRQDDLNDEIATHGKSIAAQVAYYNQQISLLDASDADQEERIKKLYDDIYQAEADGYKKLETLADDANKKVLADQQDLDKALEEERKKSLAEATKDVDTFLNDILDKHESFKASLTGILKQIQSQYAQTFSTSITNAFSKLFGSSGASNAASTNPTTAAENKLATDTEAATVASENLKNATSTLGNTAIPNLGTSTDALKGVNATLNSTVGDNTKAVNALTQQVQKANQQSTSQNGTSPELTIGNFSPLALTQTTGLPTGVSPTSLTAASNSDDFSDVEDDATDAGLFSAGSASGPNAWAGSGTSYLGGALGLLQGLSSGGSFSETLGGIGGLAGTALGGVAGGAIGSTLGSLLGSLFGPKVNASTQPDNFESQTNYGQDMANLTGLGLNAAGADGVEYNTSSSVASFIQAMGLTSPGFNALQNSNQDGAYGLDAMITYLDKYSAANPPPGITAAQFTQMQSLLGTNTSETFGTYNSNIGDLQLSNGQDTTYSTLAQYLSAVMGSQAVAGGSTGVYSLTHSMPNFETTAMQQIGTFQNGIYSGSQPKVTTPTGTAGDPIHVVPVSPIGTPGGGLINEGSGNMRTQVTVNVNGGVLVGANAKAELAQIIEQQINQNAYNNYGNRNSGSF